MNEAAATMFTESAASEIPTARASMEVATASMRYSPRSIRSASFVLPVGSPPDSSSCVASQSIFPPMKASSPNAIQWSIGAMSQSNWLPSAQPMVGMSA